LWEIVLQNVHPHADELIMFTQTATSMAPAKSETVNDVNQVVFSDEVQSKPLFNNSFCYFAGMEAWLF